MKYYFFISILIFEVFGCCENNDQKDDYLGYVVVGSDYRASEEDKWWPCYLDDYECMSYFLASNSQCFPTVPGFLPDPIHLPIEKFRIPVASISVTHFDAKSTGFGQAKVTQFCVNKATGNVIIAVTIPTYNFSADHYFTYQRTGQESISLNDFATFEIDNPEITAVIPKVPDLRLDMADIFIDTHNALPRAYIGPKAYRSDDPIVKSRYADFKKHMVTVMKEVFVFHSYLLMTTFIQDKLCNFGLNSYRNYDGYLLGKCHPETAKK